MKIIYGFLLFFCATLSYAQVGINTTTPDPSSILDVTSTEAGMLIPRMTTSQRQAITDPAEGLIVYDLDAAALFIFSDGSWEEQGTAKKRENYKLIQIPADLAEELVAGGNSKYLLQSDFLYEINGIIPLAFPIDLNNATLKGRDGFEDIVFNASGQTLIQSSTGGTIRDLSLAGNGSEILDINGGATDVLFITDCAFTNASNVGTIDGVGTVYIGLGQFLDNNGGFIVKDVASFFMTNTFWTVSNSGTFLTLNGTFDNLQLTNGRIIADAGETGIDVSNNPIINNDATLSTLSFVGDGLMIDPYTIGSYEGYNFTSQWNVNCSGIPLEVDFQATGNFYSTSSLTSGFAQSISNDNEVEVQGSSSTFDNTELFRFSATGGNNRLVYEGNKLRGFQINASLSVRVINAAGNFYSFLIAKNGVVVEDSDSLVLIENNTQVQSISLNTVVQLDTGDYIEIFVKRLTGDGTDTLVVFSENLTIK